MGKEGLHFADHSPQDHSKDDRRSTQLFGNVAAPVAHVVRNLPSWDGIHLRRLYVEDVVQFCRDIDRYRRRNNADIPFPASLIDEAAINELIARNNGELSQDTVMQLPYKDLGMYLMKACQPYSADLFQHYLERYVKFDLHKDFIPTVSSYFKFKDKLLTYKDKFVYYYTIMSQHNNKKNVPKLNIPKEGLIDIFLSEIPFQYGKKLKKEMEESQFETFADFLEKFFKLAQRDAKIIEKAKVVLMRFKDAYPSRATASSHLVQNIADFALVPDEVHIEESLKKRADEDDDTLDGLDFPQDEDMDDLIQQLSGHSSHNKKDFARSSKSRDTNKAVKSTPKGCAQKLFRGECSRLPKCSKEHDTKSLQDACQYYLRILQNSPYNVHRVNSVLSRPPTVEIADDPSNLRDY